MAAPRPREPPVTRATLPAMFLEAEGAEDAAEEMRAFMGSSELVFEDELFCNERYRTGPRGARQPFLYRKVSIYLKAGFSTAY